MARKSSILSISLPAELAADVKSLAAAERRSSSEIVREAIRQYVRLAHWRRLRELASLKAVEAAVREADVERLLDEVRGARATCLHYLPKLLP